MPNKLSGKTIQRIERLFQQDNSLENISETVGVSYGTVYGYTRAKERGFKSRSDYAVDDHILVK